MPDGFRCIFLNKNGLLRLVGMFCAGTVCSYRRV